MRVHGLGASLTLVASLGCGGTELEDIGSSGQTATATTTADTTFGTSDATGDAGDGDGDATDSGGDGDGSAPPPLCVTECASAADCDLGGGPAFDVDNYSCDAGGCVYTGCTTDDECDAQTPGSLCRGFDGATPSCVGSCVTPDDCAGVGAAFDGDNYACDGGVCRYVGCNSDAECSDLIPGQVCHDPGTGFSACTGACTTAADCPLPEQYECPDGACVFVGCESDAECFSGFVCRG